jgi:hypothetical protein
MNCKDIDVIKRAGINTKTSAGLFFLILPLCFSFLCTKRFDNSLRDLILTVPMYYRF